jgi:hypothetical protein
MAIPTAYLTTVKNLEGMLNAIVNARAPEKFTQRYLESLGFKSNSDRLMIGVLKSIDFLAEDGKPTPRYFEYLDQTQSGRVLAIAIGDAYEDIFQVNKNAQTMETGAVVNKLKTLTQGDYSDAVLKKMATTFTTLCSLADWDAPAPKPKDIDPPLEESPDEKPPKLPQSTNPINLGGLVYNIQLILPESRDPKVYDALFQSLRKHLQ